MNTKKALPFILLIIMAVTAIAIRRCNSVSVETTKASNTKTQGVPSRRKSSPPITTKPQIDNSGLNRKTAKLFFTKHARCRMKCRHITQQEVKDILAAGTINYAKSDLQDPRGNTYAVEGITRDRQKVRIIFAPKKQHVSVVTVIDLQEEFACNCN
jgi:hypothetical protein